MATYSYKNELNASISIGTYTFNPKEIKVYDFRQPILDEYVNLDTFTRYIDNSLDETVPTSDLEKHNEDHRHMSGVIYGNATFAGLSTFGTLSAYDEATDHWGFGTINPTHQIHAVIRDGENILIDGRTNPRNYTFGVMRFEHTAAMAGTRPITLDIDCNGFSTKGIVTDFKATGLVEGSSHIYEVNADTANSTGGDIQVLAVSKLGTGLAQVCILEAYPGVKVLLQKTGSPEALTQAWKASGAAYTDVTTAFSTGLNVELFTARYDYIYCGADSVFSNIEINLAIKASNTILAIFQYSTGTGNWQTFNPSDGTNGFTTNGNIMWTGSLAGWALNTVNGVAKYYIRIQRTRNSLATVPSEATVQITSSIDFYWDEDANVKMKTLAISGSPVFADRTAALAGGLVTGQIYQTSTGQLMIA